MKDDDLNMPEPRERDPSIFNSGAIGISPDAVDWQKSDSGKAYLEGVTGNTIVGHVTERMSPDEYIARYRT